MTGDVIEKMATPEDHNGKAVWIVELKTAEQEATVMVDAESGDVVDVNIK